MEVTDGWYSVRATLDALLAELLQRGKLRMGTGTPACDSLGPHTGDAPSTQGQSAPDVVLA